MTDPIHRHVLTAFMIALSAFGPQGQRTASRGLRIVVIEGEDAVNVIQQKTAVRPLIELRDYNDLPVGGATVTFSIIGGRASFAGGAQQIAVTTDAAGRAAASALNPLSNGQVSIRIEAAFQGQTATATVSQTNVATAAEAARVAKQTGSSSSGAGAAGTTAGAASAGGGLSGAAIAGIVGGVAAGAGLGLKAASGGSDDGGTGGGGGGGTSSPQCTFSVSPESVSTSSGPSTTIVTVTVQPANCANPTWSASTTASFFGLSGGSSQGPFTGTATFSVNIPANQSGASRTGSVSITPIGRTVQVTQAADCRFTVMPTSFGNISGLATSEVVAVMLANSPCDPQTWTAFSNTPPYVSVSPTSGSGSGLVTVSFTQHGPLAQAPRPVSVTVAGVRIDGNQLVAGSTAMTCQARSFRGSDAGGQELIELGRAAGTFLFTYDTGGESADRILVRHDGRVLFDTGCLRTSRVETRALRYAGVSSQVTVQVMPNCDGGTGSSWTVDVACPR
jgi:hypothetical protein